MSKWPVRVSEAGSPRHLKYIHRKSTSLLFLSTNKIIPCIFQNSHIFCACSATVLSTKIPLPRMNVSVHQMNSHLYTKSGFEIPIYSNQFPEVAWLVRASGLLKYGKRKSTCLLSLSLFLSAKSSKLRIHLPKQLRFLHMLCSCYVSVTKTTAKPPTCLCPPKKPISMYTTGLF